MGIPKSYFNWCCLPPQQQIGLILIFHFRNCLTTQLGKWVSCVCVALSSKIHKKALTVHVGLDCAFFTQAAKQGRTTRLGHKHRCCWVSALRLAAIGNPQGYHPPGSQVTPLIPSKWALIQLVSKYGDSPENGNCKLKKKYTNKTSDHTWQTSPSATTDLLA